MNTNSKHYEILAIEPWDIMEANFPPHEFIAYLKGNIIKYTLRSKGQDLTDAEKIKHYAEKLIEVLETIENDKDNWTITGMELEEPEVKHKFKVGDRVGVYKDGEGAGLTGTVKRLPTKNYQGRSYYIINLDQEGEGWEANRLTHGVDCDNAWYTVEDSLTLLQHEPKKTLKPNKWYDAEDYTVKELRTLLPVGTKVFVIEDYTSNSNNAVEFARETWLKTTVRNIDKRTDTEQTRVGITRDIFFRRYFRIVEEN